MQLKTEFITFPKRIDRSNFVSKRFDKHLTSSVLDVGCYEAPLRDLLKNASYTGVDIAGKPDIEIDLEKVDKLPFDDNAFDTVLCIDVLEHLDNLHTIFGEIIRVSKKTVIIALPNCWRDARGPIEKGAGSFKHYGLEPEKPLDRHKWFFNIEQAINFITTRADKDGFKIQELFVTEKPKNSFLCSLRKLRYAGMKYHNRYSQTLWTVLEKKTT